MTDHPEALYLEKNARPPVLTRFRKEGVEYVEYVPRDQLTKTPSVCTHSGDQPIETVPKSVADKLAYNLRKIKRLTAESDILKMSSEALAEYNNFKQGK